MQKLTQLVLAMHDYVRTAAVIVAATSVALVGCDSVTSSNPTTVTLQEAEEITNDAVAPLIEEIKMLNGALEEANETITSLERKLAYSDREREQVAIQRDELQGRVDSLSQRFAELNRAVDDMKRSLQSIQQLLPERSQSKGADEQRNPRRQALRDSDDD